MVTSACIQHITPRLRPTNRIEMNQFCCLHVYVTIVMLIEKKKIQFVFFFFIRYYQQARLLWAAFRTQRLSLKALNTIQHLQHLSSNRDHL